MTNPRDDIELQRLELEQSAYEMNRKTRIGALYNKYGTGRDDEKLAAVEKRMTPADRAELKQLWADLGNLMVIDTTKGK